MASEPEDRIFVKKPFKHYRRTYSRREVQIGAGVLLGLGLITVWVVWMGAHPDPELFASAPPQASRGPAGAESPFPSDLAVEGWTAEPVRAFGPDNLYEKINGRETYYKSFGFEALYFVSLSGAGGKSIDVELYDQGSASNALGAYAGEASPDSEPRWSGGSMQHTTSNAFFMARGRYYLRALGADTSASTLAQLREVERRMTEALPPGSLPWGYAVLEQALELGPARVSFVPENAFSFEFADGVFVGLLPDDETEVFVLRGTEDSTVAAFAEGFGAYGEEVEGTAWIQDRYLGRMSRAEDAGAYVVGVRGAADVAAGDDLVEALKAALAASKPNPGDPGEAPSSGPEELDDPEGEYESGAP